MGNRVVYLPAYEAEVEYLETDGDSYIDTGLKASSELGVLAHIQNCQDVTSFLFGGCDERNNKEFAFLGLSDGGNSIYRFGTGSIEGAKLDADIIYEFDNTQSHNIMEVGNLTYTAPTTTFESSYNLILFGENRRGVRQKSIGVRIYDFKIYSGSTLVRDFIPVRIGTTGYMYDKVSRQLFANAGTGRFVLGNDVANATVPQLRHVVYFEGQRCVGFEKVYEKCAWLKGRNGAYIDTNLVPSQSDHIDCHYRYDGITKNPDGEEQDIFGVYTNLNDGTSYRCRAYINTNNFLSVQFNRANSFPTTGKTITDGNITNLHLNGEKYYFDVNGEHFNFPSNSDTYIESKSIWLFKYNTGGSINRYFHGDIAYFRITDPTFSINRINMFPCRLLVDIPAILDGNGIARQAGTCGMWDTVSGRFFGNVADRGTFDVVYMEEGVDYEVHQWLVGHLNEGVSPTGISNGANFRLDRSIDLTNKVMKMKFDTPCRDFAIYGEVVSAGNLYCLRTFIFENGSQYLRETIGSTEINSISQSTKNDEVIFDFVNNVASAGNISIPIEGTGYSYSNVYGIYWSTTKTIGNITIDNELNLVPVKLLRSIPSKYDANGIARQAGECGMYDTVNDKFYGNVASSGTFSVSDD